MRLLVWQFSRCHNAFDDFQYFAQLEPIIIFAPQKTGCRTLFRPDGHTLLPPLPSTSTGCYGISHERLMAAKMGCSDNGRELLQQQQYTALNRINAATIG